VKTSQVLIQKIKMPILKKDNLTGKLACLFYILIFFTSCDKYRIYETNHEFKEKKWSSDSVIVFEFEVADTNLRYNIIYNVRNTLNYPYYNLYLKYKLLGENKKLLSEDLQEVQLMDSKTGEPFGSGLGDIFDNKFYALKNLKFKKGKHKFKIQHYMRKSQLNEILSFGIRVEKTK
jgi:gliding motility-associated lipoprotein GldH